ncbi:hypothetical protein M427DRAFT_103485 [Gonapodya prolifera JEL478]|uniref:Rap-GAP domain-containing protein n=1 Tax=Gonapodya prolifera (strain JEL478) TaxID=1344416 RepID=A0A139A178_GONPJ|nr:hypothetical protein M427DRAFT_103485 [Gonapodya prolifera JEL478]|eukprot:KXS10536.1 hypothetical protein M427DRAFT_103485 [Gonapodya prolifera JEL478]
MSISVEDSGWAILPTNRSAHVQGVHESLLQECEKDIIWYRENFFGKPHYNYLGVETERGPIAISIVEGNENWKVLVRTKTGSERLTVPTKSVPVPFLRKIFGLGPPLESVMQAASSNIPVSAVTLSRELALPNELLAMEERQVIRSYKFGVAYLTTGQTTEQEMLRNRTERTSKAYQQFLSFLGERIELKGWKGYRAGLDTSASGNTGTHSIYTKWQSYEIMFHVATLLPYTEHEPQQVERKRHLGNDIVLIVFQDPEAGKLRIKTVASKQNHVVAAVQPCPEGYRVQFVAKEGVPSFSPELPEPTIIGSDATARDFFLHKLVNAERASYKAPSFAPKIQRTRNVLLTDVCTKYAS